MTPRNDRTALDLGDITKHADWLVHGHLADRKDDITVLAVDEIARRNAESNQLDGYPASATGGGGGHGGDIANPVHRIAEALHDDADLVARRAAADLVDHAHRAIAEHVRKASEHMAQAVSMSYLVWRKQRAGVNGSEPTHCRACDRLVMCTENDPIRKGYCSACDTAWRRWKSAEVEAGRQPDRARFEIARRSEAA